LAEFTPYVSIKTEKGEMFIQNGQVFSMSGPPISDPPQWFLDEVKKLTPEALAEVKWPSGGGKDPEPESRAFQGAPVTVPIRKRGRPKKVRESDG